MSILDLDLDFNVNVISPMWPESDFSLTDADTDVDADAILAFAETEDLSFSTPDATNDIIWDANCVQTQNFCFEYNDSCNLTPILNNSEVLESWHETDTCNFDALKDSLFELEVFEECLKEVDNQSESAPCSSAQTCEASPITIDPIAEWNRRRSLLYDKNEFVQNERNRERHGRQERRIKSASTSTAATTSIDQRTFRCSIRDCDKTYYKASHLKSHMRRHSGVKPFACDWDGCKWRFSRSDELARHKRSHSGIKPYSCNLCEKAFSRSDHLSKHAKVHMKKLALYGTPIITKKCNYKYLTVNRSPVE